ncbi:probable serine/threonine-protein kinase SIS8 isoform X1 [Cryptomeria japonica]|uniref:probable serine/threonine-protein kinase SIS8 isoform X1 n=1 Tax=Cryptomeria japonica TaxID=3369 RepID=UPI0025AD0C65|nr:probable serine/threonine-protein kinase SIS8 isoform X1 [Cryptomeria japonica]
MKNILRKLHIGSSVDGGGRALDARSPPPGLLPSPSSTTGGRTGASTGTATGTSEEDVLMDYNYFEEEYQVQLALAISASSSNTDSICNDPESLQINAAKRISLGHSPSPSPANTPAEFLAHRYWSYNVVDYDEKVMDGFYDVYGILSDPNSQGKMPSLVDLQGTPVSDNIGYEVVLVNRILDPALQQLEQKALGISLELKAADLGPLDSGLVQGVADLVAEHMGGAVNDADDMLTRWTVRCYGLRSMLNSIVLPLGRLQIGLSRHRALLFKVLADRVGIPCRLVKGSHYTGTDDGAINIIKLDHEREFIIDLMGAPGTLIPVETPRTVHAQSPVLDKSNTGQVILAQAVQDLCSTLEEKDIGLFVDRREAAGQSNNDSGDCKWKDEKLNLDAASSRVLESGMKDVKLNERPQFHCIEQGLGKSNSLFNRPRRSPSWTEGVASPAEQMKVKNVSQCVIAANENPDFAQRLHAVLLESGVPAPPHLFDDISSQQFAGQKVSQHKGNNQEKGTYEFQRRREKVPSGPGRPPQPIMRKNSMTRNGVGEKSQVQLGNRLELRRVSEELTDTVSGASSLIAATSECCQPPTKGPSAVENAIVTPVALANQKHTRVDNISPHNLVDREHACNRGRRELMESGSVMHGESVDSRNNADELGPSISSCNTKHPLMDDVAECEIPWENLLIGERIGLGSYGEVYHADWNGTEVAVKKFLDQDFSGDALEQFRSEVRIMQRLRHPNIVLFMGAVTRPPNLSILTEFLPRGSLYKLLHRPNIQIDEKRRLRMALDVAKGMNYLHTSNPTIVHRDLKSPNLLVDKNWNVKVCDFGLSRLKHHTFLSSKSTAGTPEWMAPEVLRNELSNEKCDVYSFGVILWELATLRMPWSGMNPMQVVGAVGFQDRRLDIPKEVDPMVAKIISACWQNDPSLRPSFAQLMASLKPLQRLVLLPQSEL